MLHIDVVRNDEEFLALEREWKELICETPGVTYFLTWEFTSIRWKHFSDGRELYILTARDANNKLVGIAPWAIGPASVGSMQIRRLEFLCRVEIPFRFEQYFLDGEAMDIVAHPEQRSEVGRAFLDHLDECRDRWDIVDLAWLTADSSLREHLNSTTTFVVERKAPCVWSVLPDDWQTFERDVLGKKRAKQLRYQARLLERHYPGEVAYRTITCEDEIGPTVDLLDEMKLRQFAAKGRETPQNDDPVVLVHRRFKRELAEAAFDRGWWRFYELSVGDVMIAATCGIVLHGNYYGLHTAYDPDWKRYGPGNLIQVYEVEQVIAEGVRGFDPGHGMNESKRMWTDLEREDFRVIANHGWRGMPYLAREVAMTTAKEHGRSLVRRLLPTSTYRWITKSVSDKARALSSGQSSLSNAPNGTVESDA